MKVAVAVDLEKLEAVIVVLTEEHVVELRIPRRALLLLPRLLEQDVVRLAMATLGVKVSVRRRGRGR